MRGPQSFLVLKVRSAEPTNGGGDTALRRIGMACGTCRLHCRDATSRRQLLASSISLQRWDVGATGQVGFSIQNSLGAFLSSTGRLAWALSASTWLLTPATRKHGEKLPSLRRACRMRSLRELCGETGRPALIKFGFTGSTRRAGRGEGLFEFVRDRGEFVLDGIREGLGEACRDWFGDLEGRGDLTGRDREGRGDLDGRGEACADLGVADGDRDPRPLSGDSPRRTCPGPAASEENLHGFGLRFSTLTDRAQRLLCMPSSSAQPSGTGRAFLGSGSLEKMRA